MNGPQNTLADLNNHLFATLERLNDDELMETNAETEIQRANAVSSVATQIINNAQLALKAEEFKAEYGLKQTGVRMLETN